MCYPSIDISMVEAPVLIKRPSDILSSEITSEKDYQDRRSFLVGAAALSVGTIAPACRVKAS